MAYMQFKGLPATRVSFENHADIAFSNDLFIQRFIHELIDSATILTRLTALTVQNVRDWEDYYLEFEHLCTMIELHNSYYSKQIREEINYYLYSVHEAIDDIENTEMLLAIYMALKGFSKNEKVVYKRPSDPDEYSTSLSRFFA